MPYPNPNLKIQKSLTNEENAQIIGEKKQKNNSARYKPWVSSIDD